MPQPAVPPPLTEKSWHAWVLSFFAWPGVADLTGHDSLAPRATKHGINPVGHGKNALPAVVEETSLSRKTYRSIPPPTWKPARPSPSGTRFRHLPGERTDGRMDTPLSFSAGPFTSRRPRSRKFKAATLPIQRNRETRSCRQPPLDTISVTRTISLRLNHAAISSRYRPSPFQARNLPRIILLGPAHPISTLADCQNAKKRRPHTLSVT